MKKITILKIFLRLFDIRSYFDTFTKVVVYWNIC